ncbi:MAG: hypothetical protein IJA94_06500 [Bacilli bacterium]|nr:hypothetical protein [Bacilli bacterium]
MWAEVELNDEILQFINKAKKHNETFEEIIELVFTQERINKTTSAPEMLLLSLQFQEIKRNALDKILNKKRLNFPEGFVIERLMAKYMNQEYVPVEEHIKQIRLNCCNDRKSKRENERKVTKLYNKFILNLFK